MMLMIVDDVDVDGTLCTVLLASGDKFRHSRYWC